MTRIEASGQLAIALIRAGITEHPGYIGAFTRRQARGAIPNGTEIIKIFSELGDRTPIGQTGVVLGSIELKQFGLLYFIEWNHSKGFAVSAVEKKIGRTN